MFGIVQKTFLFGIFLWPVSFGLFNRETILKLRHIVPSYHKCPSQDISNQVLQYTANRKMWSKAHLLLQFFNVKIGKYSYTLVTYCNGFQT